MPVRDVHVDSLATSTALSEYYRPKMISPFDVIRILNGAGVSYMLVGLHGIGGWMKEPRATQDVDILTSARHHRKAVQALIAAYPNLEVVERDVVTRFKDPETQQVVIDLMRPNQQLFRVALKHTKEVRTQGQSFKIPSLEMALAMKFAPMISLHRLDEDKYQDAHDFILLVKANPDIDLEKLHELGDLVYPGGGKELVEKVGQVRRGEKLIL